MLGIREGVIHVFLSKIFCFTVPKLFVGDPFNFQFFRVSENVRDKSGGVSRFSVEKFGLTVPKIIIGQDFWAVFQKIFGGENFLDKRGGGGGLYQDFPSKIFCLRVPKEFVGEPISVSLFLGIDNFYASEG